MAIALVANPSRGSGQWGNRMTDAERKAKFLRDWGPACQAAAHATGIYGGDGARLLAELGQRSGWSRVACYHNLLELPAGDAGHAVLVHCQADPDVQGGVVPVCKRIGKFSGPGPAALAHAHALLAAQHGA